jgi:hypothetical protein
MVDSQVCQTIAAQRTRPMFSVRTGGARGRERMAGAAARMMVLSIPTIDDSQKTENYQNRQIDYIRIYPMVLPYTSISLGIIGEELFNN